MPKSFSEFPHTVSSAVTPLVHKLLQNESNRSDRSVAKIIREALYEYFDIEESPTVMVRITPELARKLRAAGDAK